MEIKRMLIKFYNKVLKRQKNVTRHGQQLSIALVIVVLIVLQLNAGRYLFA